MGNVFIPQIEGDNDIIYASINPTGTLSFTPNSLLSSTGSILNNKIEQRLNNGLLRFIAVLPKTLDLSWPVTSSEQISASVVFGNASGNKTYAYYDTVRSAIGSDRYYRANFSIEQNKIYIQNAWTGALMFRITTSTNPPSGVTPQLSGNGFYCEGYNFALIPEYGYFK